MRIKFPSKFEKLLRFIKYQFFPKTLFFRTMLLIFVPLIFVQVVSIYAFFDSSWSKIGKRMSDNLVGDMAMLISLHEEFPQSIDKIQKLAEDDLDIHFAYIPDSKEISVLESYYNSKIVTGFLENALKKSFPSATSNVYLNDKASSGESNLTVFIDSSLGGLYKFSTSSKNVFSTSTFGFMAWMIGSGLLLFVVAALFLRVQVRSIAELAQSAEDFGKGIDNKEFKPYGSLEVRRAGIAFIKMKERIQRQISERTNMLAGVSHDLRTPLTRMKLQLAMTKESTEREEFLQDISEMEKMLDGYLAFVSGEEGESSSFIDVNEMILSIINKFRNTKAMIRYATNDQVSAIQGREQGLKRALTNVISNAFNYGQTVSVSLESNNRKMEIKIDDDGPGIPEDKREEVFKAFYRIDDSRNKETGGVGLGLSIAKDVVTSHGGKIELQDSPLGGLRVLISIPL
ncbi:MAG: ATP-binding protein [Alphaproteobacteria bacterium]|nr:ATP-binding protein [Alphaproteobacteria bacterium]